MAFDCNLIAHKSTGFADSIDNLVKQLGWFSTIREQWIVRGVEELEDKAFVGHPRDDMSKPPVFDHAFAPQTKKNVLHLFEGLILRVFIFRVFSGFLQGTGPNTHPGQYIVGKHAVAHEHAVRATG